jgi:hypothetical protein
MRPDVVRLSLPFPRQSGVHYYHDLWLGLIASATDGVRLVTALEAAPVSLWCS